MRPILVVAIIFSATSLIAQDSERNYIPGTLIGSKTLKGYFWFDRSLSQMGQRILYKESLNQKKKKTLYAKDFKTFTGDGIFLRTFKTIPYGTGRLDAMIPRVVEGKFELYSAIYKNYYAFKDSDHYYLYDGRENIRLVKRKFKDQMNEFLKDDTDIIQKIDRGEVTYEDMPTIIYNYNQRYQKSVVGSQ